MKNQNERKRLFRILKKVHDQNNALKSFADKIKLKECKGNSVKVNVK